ncbi:MAG: multicopper oxidase domain-containing protein [Anaerolineales bacterium]|nr:multicopper oxidase domain-containing protein [Anaerolineales bacterium]
MRKTLSRRNLFKIAGGAALAAAGASMLPRFTSKGGWLSPSWSADAQQAAPNLSMAATDGWIALPPDSAMAPYHPDSLAPAGLTTYIFGFRNVTGLTPEQMMAQKMRAQHSAPLFWVNQNTQFTLQLTNLGLAMRPDLVDAHTLHWHGFRHVIPFFDGEPMGSVSVPIERNFTYAFRPRDPGTYMYHCHVEDIEHVHMGMTGMVFVRSAQDGTTLNFNGRDYTRFAYNDGDGSTGFDRQFSLLLSEVWNEAHWDDAHIQLPQWTDYRVDFGLLNGRVYPDTIAPNSPMIDWTANNIDPATFNAMPVLTDGTGDLMANAGLESLRYQPLSSLITCNAGERVLLRFANLGFTEAAMTATGLKMQIIGRDATLMRGRTGADTSYLSSTATFNAGESVDAIFTAPPHSGNSPYDAYLLYNRAMTHGNGSQMTEIRVYPANTLAPQALPNT